MIFKFSSRPPESRDVGNMQWLPIRLYGQDESVVEASGLVDSGSAVNVLPRALGESLRLTWIERRAQHSLSGGLRNVRAIPVVIKGQVGEYSPVNLGFAWAESDDVPLILGQSNFFREFDVFFYRSELEFEIKPKRSRS